MTMHRRQPATIDRDSQTLRGVLAKIRFRSEASGFTIATLRSGEVVKGNLREPRPGLEYELRGAWVNDPRFGWGFAFQEAASVVPSTDAGIQDYLEAHAPWVGPGVARAIVEAFGEAAIHVLKTDPERVAEEIRGITDERAEQIQAALRAVESLERAEVAVRGLVGPAGVNARQLNAILKLHGAEAPDVVRANPYRLIEEVDGIGWITADRIGSAVGIEPGAPARMRAGILHALSTAEDDGHTCLARTSLVAAAGELLGLGAAAVADEIDDLLAAEELIAYDPPIGAAPPEARIYRPSTFAAEERVASAVARLLRPRPAAGASS